MMFGKGGWEAGGCMGGDCPYIADGLRVHAVWYGRRMVWLVTHDACWSHAYENEIEQLISGEWAGYELDEVVSHEQLEAATWGEGP